MTLSKNKQLWKMCDNRYELQKVMSCVWKEKFKYWRSIIPPISTKQSTIPHLQTDHGMYRWKFKSWHGGGAQMLWGLSG